MLKPIKPSSTPSSSAPGLMGPGRVALALLLATVLPPGSAAEALAHPLEDIAASATAYVRDQAANGGGELAITPPRIDPRVRLAQCQEPLSTQAAPIVPGQRGVTVEVRCANPPWGLFVPLRIAMARRVVVASRDLPAGTVLGPQDVRVESRDLSSVGRDPIEDPGTLLGKTLKAHVSSGGPLLSPMITEAAAIRRGDIVTLLAGGAGFTIRAAGEALTDASLGGRVKVRNSASQKVVVGIVEGPGLVRVLSP